MLIPYYYPQTRPGLRHISGPAEMTMASTDS